MAVSAFNEGTQFPENPEQWERFYRTDEGAVYVQVLPKATTGSVPIVAAPSGLSRSSNVVTVTCAEPHGFSAGQVISISGASDSSFDGEHTVLDVPSQDSFRFLQYGSDATSGGGTASPAYPKWEKSDDSGAVEASRRLPGGMPWAHYLARDYQTWLDELLSWLKRNVGAQEFSAYRDSDVAMTILRYTAAALDQAAWYLDMEVAQQYLQTASLRTRVERLAEYLGFSASGASASRVSVVLALSEPLPFDVVVPEGFGFSSDGVRWEMESRVVIPAGQTSVSATLVQGRMEEETFVSDGSKWQTFSLSGLSDGEEVEHESVEVYVGGVAWNEVDVLSPDVDPATAFSVRYLSAQVRFGDGVSGEVPPSGTEVLVRYRATLGKAASVTANAEWTQEDDLVVAGQDVSLAVSNSEASSGGGSATSLDTVKASAPAWYASADRGVTARDLRALAEKFPGIALADVRPVRFIDQDAELNKKIDTVEGALFSASASLSSVHSDLSSADASLVNADNELVSAAAGVSGASDKADLADAQLDDVETASQGWSKEVIGTGDGTTTYFSATLSKKPVVRRSVAVYVGEQTVEKSGNDGDLDSASGRLTVASGPFEASDVGKAIRIAGELRTIVSYVSATQVVYSGEPLSGTGQVWVVYGDNVVALDDGSGSLSGTGVTSGTVDYSNGAVTVTFSSPPLGAGDYGAPIYVEYKWENEAAEGKISTVRGTLNDLKSLLSAASTDISDARTGISNARANVSTADSTVSAASGHCSDAETALDAVTSYLSGVISDECRANVVRVSVLSEDESGAYVPVSVAQVDDVRSELAEKVVAPAVLSVVDGYYFAVKVDVRVSIRVAPPHRFEGVQAQVRDAVLGTLNGREFGEDLYLSDIYSAVVFDGTNGVQGVSKATVTVESVSWADSSRTGSPNVTLSDGNVLVPDDLVLVPGTVTVVEDTNA